MMRPQQGIFRIGIADNRGALMAERFIRSLAGTTPFNSI